MDRNLSVLIADSSSMVGARITDSLKSRGFETLYDVNSLSLLKVEAQIEELIAGCRPDYIFLTAGPSGGIGANTEFPAELLRDNLIVECNVIHLAHKYGVKKLLYFASSCCYPKHCPQPMKTSSLMSGPLEPSSDSYAIAKLAGIKLCQAYRQEYGSNFISVIPSDIFGPGDEFHPDHSHVIPGLIRRMHEAKVLVSPIVKVWGSGLPERDFIFVDDLVEACLLAMYKFDESEPLNIGGGGHTSIAEVATLVKEVVGYAGQLEFDLTKPDGTPVKVLDTSVLQALGWGPRVSLRTALSRTYQSYVESVESGTIDKSIVT